MPSDQELARDWTDFFRRMDAKDEDAVVVPSSCETIAALLDRLSKGETEYRIVTDDGELIEADVTADEGRNSCRLYSDHRLESRHVGSWRKVEE